MVWILRLQRLSNSVFHDRLHKNVILWLLGWKGIVSHGGKTENVPVSAECICHLKWLHPLNKRQLLKFFSTAYSWMRFCHEWVVIQSVCVTATALWADTLLYVTVNGMTLIFYLSQVTCLLSTCNPTWFNVHFSYGWKELWPFPCIFKLFYHQLDSEILKAEPYRYVWFFPLNSFLNLYSPALRQSLNLRPHLRDLRGISEWESNEQASHHRGALDQVREATKSKLLVFCY